MAGDVEIIIGAVGEVGAVVELSKQSRVTTLGRGTVSSSGLTTGWEHSSSVGARGVAGAGLGAGMMTKVRVPDIWQRVEQMSWTDLPHSLRLFTSSTSSAHSQGKHKVFSIMPILCLPPDRPVSRSSRIHSSIL